MLERTKKLPIKTTEARFIGSDESIRRLKEFAVKEGLTDISGRISWREVLPEQTKETLPGTLLSGYRYREGLTQEELAKISGIQRRHISEMEHGKRPIGKENAKKLGQALGVDYRVLM
ncbi:MAG: helix-turn-helix transcriptional regulator [Pseudomonadota bacterium]